MEQLMEKYLTPFAVKLGNIKGLIAIRDGVSLAMPLIIGGSIFLIINSFPVPGWPEFLATLLDGKLSSMLNHIVNSTFGLMGLIATFGIARSMAQQYNVDGASAGVIAMSAWLILTPNIITDTAEGVPVSYLGSKGLFIGIVVGLVSAWIFKSFVLKNIVIKMPDSVPPAVSKSFSALIPGVVVFFLAGVVALLIDISPFENAHELLATILAVPLGFIGGTLPGAIIVVALNSLFWFVGIHGGNVVGSVTNPIFLANTDENRLALQAGKELPHIITTQFFDMFAYIGGGGAVFGLAIALLFFGKSSQSKAMKGIAVTPNIFNISEPIMFGMPVMLNMSYLIPFVLAPIVNVLITYFSMSVGLVHKTIGVAVPWTTPPIISGWLATGSWTGAGLQIVLILIDMAIYLPFFLAADRAQRQGLEI
ncbi:MAG: PTS sugar transporter subunit IIC [Streptococcaceae bacterium]|nr:PTS sugar transporter subunit IIC [Streptococcaceae bacterium]MCH4176133.1 PTS sugar transporter subunit IIC [Streptococcaceae bacterium]